MLLGESASTRGTNYFKNLENYLSKLFTVQDLSSTVGQLVTSTLHKERKYAVHLEPEEIKRKYVLHR